MAGHRGSPVSRALAQLKRREQAHTERHRKCAALANLAFDADLAPAHAHQSPGNRQAEPGAAVLACDAAIGLREFLENCSQFVGRNPRAGVVNLKLHVDAPVEARRRMQAHAYLAAVGELNGVR